MDSLSNFKSLTEMTTGDRKRRLRGLLFAASSLAVLAYVGSASAQVSAEGAGLGEDVDTSDLAKMSLEDLLSMSVVTASGGSGEALVTAAGNVTVITRQDMRDNGWHSVAEALEGIPGLYVTDDGSVKSVSVRGVTPGLRGGTRLVKLMINGVPVSFRPDLRAFIGPEYLPIEVIDRIEVVKGPLSALYGTDAFIATINVVTRKPTAGTSTEASGMLTTVNGQPGYGGSAASMYSGEHARLLLAASVGRFDRSGLSIQKTFAAQDPTTTRYRPFFGEETENDISSPVSAFIQVAVPTRKYGELTLDAGLQQVDASAEFQLNSVLTHRSRDSLRNMWAALRHEAQWTNELSTRFAFSVSQGEPMRDDAMMLTGNLSRTFTRNFGYHAYFANLSGTYSPSERFSAMLGVDADLSFENILYYTVRLDSPEGNRPAGSTFDVIPDGTPRERLLTDFGAYLQLTGQPVESLPGLKFTANGRVDAASYDDFNPPVQVSARGSVVYEWSDWFITKAMAGRAFQSPTAVLLFAQPGFGVSNNVIGNLTSGSSVPKLTPQTLTSFELTAYTVFWDYAILELSGFQQTINDKIDFVSAGTDYVARNLGSESFLGLEGSLRLSFGPLRPFLGAAYIKAVEGPQKKADHLVSYPEFTGTAGADLDIPRTPLHLNGRVRYVGPRGATAFNVIYNGREPYSLPEYATVDVTLSTSGLNLLGSEARTYFSLTARNLLDERHSEPGFGGFDVPAPGRQTYLEARQTF